MNLPISIFIGQEEIILREFGKWVATHPPRQMTKEEWFDIYATFRREHAESNGRSK